MTPLLNNPEHGWRLLWLPAVVLILLGSNVSAQTITPSATPPPFSNSQNRDRDEGSKEYGSPENEMRAKLIIKEEKKRYEENLARAREVSQLAAQVTHSYHTRKAFSSDDRKRLERLEKLTKRIRNEAGGSDTDIDAEVKELAAAMEDNLKKVADMAEQLQKLVEKTPRQVVSAAVIEQANKLIGLVQHVRGVDH